MLIRRTYIAATLALSSLGAASAGAQTVVVAPTPVPAQSQVYAAPNAPPPPRVEVVPSAPPDTAHVMTWRPGHWAWDGARWTWAQGEHVERPAPQAMWEPGHWAQQPAGGYVWVDGHWQG